MRPLLAVLLLAGVAPAAPVPKAKKPDTERLVGTWKVTAVDGKASHGGSHTFVFEAEAKCRTVYGDDNKNVAIWTWALDPDESPKRMKLAGAGDNASLSYECVYELDGDSLKIAFPGEKKTRPAKVATGAGALLYEMKRETPADK